MSIQAWRTMTVWTVAVVLLCALLAPAVVA